MHVVFLKIKINRIDSEGVSVSCFLRFFNLPVSFQENFACWVNGLR